MLHQVEVEPVILSQLAEILGIGVRSVKDMLVNGPAGIHGVTLAMDNPCLRKDEFKQTDIEKIVGHFIHNPGCGREIHLEAVEVFGSQHLHILGAKGEEAVREPEPLPDFYGFSDQGLFYYRFVDA